MNQIKELINELSMIPDVKAITLGGSRACKRNDKDSDYDVYVYSNESIDLELRYTILTKYCNYIELNNTYWETEDDAVLIGGTVIEIIYRNYIQFENQIKMVVIDGNANNGYTTCMWHNLETSVILYEKDMCYTTLKDCYHIPYPDKLKKNIIRKNFQLLTGYIPSFDKQIYKALERGDFISVNHRITEFLASYFDLVFAANDMLHPGEKRMLEIALSDCRLTPIDMADDIMMLLKCQNDKVQAVACLDRIVTNVINFVRKYNLLP